jgi:hypothetical protein
MLDDKKQEDNGVHPHKCHKKGNKQNVSSLKMASKNKWATDDPIESYFGI